MIGQGVEDTTLCSRVVWVLFEAETAAGFGNSAKSVVKR